MRPKEGGLQHRTPRFSKVEHCWQSILDVIKSASKVNYEISSVDFISVEVQFQTVSENVRPPSNLGGVLGAVVGVLAFTRHTT